MVVRACRLLVTVGRPAFFFFSLYFILKTCPPVDYSLRQDLFGLVIWKSYSASFTATAISQTVFTKTTFNGFLSPETNSTTCNLSCKRKPKGCLTLPDLIRLTRHKLGP